MKKLLLILAIGSLFSCGNDEEVTPKKIESTQAVITVKTNVKTAIVLAYMYKDEWRFEEPFIVETFTHNDTTFTVKINKDQNFAYFVNRIDDPKAVVTVNLKFKDHDQTKTFHYEGGILWDIYEFYRQEW